jgi:hypothetical protein
MSSGVEVAQPHGVFGPVGPLEVAFRFVHGAACADRVAHVRQYLRSVAEVCDGSADNHDAAVEYYREASASTLRTIWVGTGYSTCNSSGDGSTILKLRIREQMIAGEDRYGSWHY